MTPTAAPPWPSLPAGGFHDLAVTQRRTGPRTHPRLSLHRPNGRPRPTITVGGSVRSQQQVADRALRWLVPAPGRPGGRPFLARRTAGGGAASPASGRRVPRRGDRGAVGRRAAA